MEGYRNRIYNLLLNDQEAILAMLYALGVSDAKNKIKSLLDEELFEVLKCDGDRILKIRKKSTGEIFEDGGRFYHEKYDEWVEGCYFDESLFGTYYFKTYYKNYVRGRSGLYHLNEISTSEITERKKILLIANAA